MEPAGAGQVFTDADGYEVKLPKDWTLDNAFEFETEELKQIYQDADPGNCVLTEEMKAFVPTEEFLQYGSMKPQRLIVHPLNGFTDEEKAEIKKFKEFCKGKGEPVPESDSEIIRFLTRTQFDISKAYD